MGKINANNAVKNNGLFSKVLDNLNPEKSIDKAVRSGARKAYMNKLNSEEFKKLKQNHKAAEGIFKDRAKGALDKKKAEYKSEVRDNLIDNISIEDTIKAAGTGIVDYYNPYSKNSPGTLGMATRYGATALVGGTLIKGGKDIHDLNNAVGIINERERR